MIDIVTVVFEQEIPEVFDGLITIKKAVRIPGEKAWGSDVGLGFDYNPDSGEVEANPAGFKAVRDRHATGAKFPTAYPTRSPAEWREELINKLNPFN